MITIAAILAVMVAMTGTAFAATTATLSVTNDPVTIGKGDTQNQEVTMTLDPVVANAITKIEILDLPAGIDTKINGTAGTSLSGSWTSPKTWSVDLTNTAASPGTYTITYQVTYDNDKSQTRHATIEAGISPIPEFPTVALPIAAVIGLVFFFQNKKRKVE